MNKNKENFISEYKELCRKHNLMIEPDTVAALLLEEFNNDFFDERFNETRKIEEFYEMQQIVANL